MEIKRMPDLVVYKDGHAHFIEVKFRASEKFSLKDIDKKFWWHPLKWLKVRYKTGKRIREKIE